MPRPSLGGKMKPNRNSTRPKPYPARGPAAATLRKSSRLGTILIILVMAPKEPICHQSKLSRHYALHFFRHKFSPILAHKIEINEF